MIALNNNLQESHVQLFVQTLHLVAKEFVKFLSTFTITSF